LNTQTHSASRPEISAQRTPLSAYLAGAVGAAAVIAASQAEAAVTSINFGFGSTLNAADGQNNFSTVGPGFGTLRANGLFTDISLGLGPTQSYGSVYQNSSLGSTTGLASFFANGVVLGAGGSGALLGNAYFQSNNISAINFTSDHLNQNIGFRTSTNNYGWANVSWTNSTKTLAINSAYVNSIAGGTITVGDTGAAAAPEPSRALLALAGLGGVALRRRRKLAA
jgi:MYXO-CTERM domain-containing protein